MALCDAHLRPFPKPSDVQIDCVLSDDHEGDQHHGVLHNYTHPGSETTIYWLEEDRRNFHGDWPGYCTLTDCLLPAGHPRLCAS